MRLTQAKKHEDEIIASFEDRVATDRKVEVILGNKSFEEMSLFDDVEYRREANDMALLDEIRELVSFGEVETCFEYEGSVYAYCKQENLDEEVLEILIEEFADDQSYLEIL